MMIYLSGSPGPPGDPGNPGILSIHTYGPVVDLSTGSGVFSVLFAQTVTIYSLPRTIRAYASISVVSSAGTPVRFRITVNGQQVGGVCSCTPTASNQQTVAMVRSLSIAETGIYTVAIEWLRATSGTASCRSQSQPGSESASLDVDVIGL
jgi:hypothetical protein